MSDRPVILVAQPHLGLILPLLRERYDVLALWEEEDRRRLAEATAIVMAGEFALPADLLDRMPKLPRRPARPDAEAGPDRLLHGRL